MPIIFVENMICFGGKCSRLTFCEGIKMSVANKLLFTIIEETLTKLLKHVMAFVRQNTKYIFFKVVVFVTNVLPL